MFPLIIAPVAIITSTPAAPAVQGPAVEGQVLNQAGKPLAASIGLIPMFLRDEPFPLRTVENVIPAGTKKKAGFQLPIPAPGLYLLDVRARGCRPLQIPVLLGEDGLKGMEITPVPDKARAEVKPISSDINVVKLQTLYAAQKEREASYRKSIKARFDQKVNDGTKQPLPDWTADLESLATDLKNETDPDVQALAAASYLELGMMMTKLDPEMAALALDKLPATSPWWAFNPKIAGNAFAASNRSSDWASFREALATDNPDPEVRAYSLFSQASTAFNKGDKEKFTTLMGTLTTDYKDRKFAKIAKTFNLAKMPTPQEGPAPLPEVAPAAVPEAPAPAPSVTPAPAPEPVQP